MRRSPKRRSPMVHDFSRIPAANIPRSTFDLSQAYKSTLDSAGVLYPVFLQEVVPGDTHRVTANVFARLATPIKPVMDNLFIEDFYFFVPNRLVWNNWQRFMGEQDNPGDSTDYTVPTLSTDGGILRGTLADYFGIPPKTSFSSVKVSALPFRGFNLIYNEWFRSQDLVDSLNVPKDDGPDSYVLNYIPMRRRGKRHDYFTSCLPFPQFGPGVDLPLGTLAPISGLGAVDGTPTTGTNVQVNETDNPNNPVTYANSWAANNGTFHLEQDPGAGTAPNLYADLSNATAATINDLRQAFQIQKLQERDARGGHRYQELVLSHFGVRGGDARLNRPEYLGGSTHPVGITQIPQTSGGVDVADNTPQGNLAGYGTAMGRSGFTKSFTEHGYIIGIANVRADLTYQIGLDRHWSRQTKYDFYFPALARLGEQAVLNKEIFVSNSAVDEEVFGYQTRWAEMRHNNSKITGKFRSDDPASLDVWHLSQDFAVLPSLNASFIADDPPVNRVIAVPSEPHFLVDIFFQHRATRPMPIDGSPGYIDHF